MRRSRALAALALAVLCLVGARSRARRIPFAGELTRRAREGDDRADRTRRSASRRSSSPIRCVLDYVDEVGDEPGEGASSRSRSSSASPCSRTQQLNAFTIGGGYVYITRGVLEQAGDVNELAGVMAHEIGHVEKRHVARQNEGQGLSTLVTLAALAAAIAARQPEALVAAQGLNVSLQLKHSREFEAEADREGIAIMTQAGYDPEGMRRFFQRILAENPGAGAGMPAYLFTHPAVAGAHRRDQGRDGPHRRAQEREARRRELAADAGAARADPLARPERRERPARARAASTRAKTDPLLAQAREARVDGDDGARRRAARAGRSRLEPGDPRVALERARPRRGARRPRERARPARARARARPERAARAVPARLAERAARQQVARRVLPGAGGRELPAQDRGAPARGVRAGAARVQAARRERPRRRARARPRAAPFQPRRPGDLVGRDLASASTR